MSLISWLIIYDSFSVPCILLLTLKGNRMLCVYVSMGDSFGSENMRKQIDYILQEDVQNKQDPSLP